MNYSKDAHIIKAGSQYDRLITDCSLFPFVLQLYSSDYAEGLRISQNSPAKVRGFQRQFFWVNFFGVNS